MFAAIKRTSFFLLKTLRFIKKSTLNIAHTSAKAGMWRIVGGYRDSAYFRRKKNITKLLP